MLSLKRIQLNFFALVDDNVVMSNISLEGKEEFKSVFQRELYDYSSGYNPWDELLEVMAFGFRKNVVGNGANSWRANEGEIVFQAPSYQRFIENDHDIYLMVLGDHVNVREKPTIYSKKLRTVSKKKLKYELPDQGVSTIFNDGYNWVKVQFSDGQTGYIVDEFTSLKLTKEISVKKVNGEFKITSYYSLPGCLN